MPFRLLGLSNQSASMESSSSLSSVCVCVCRPVTSLKSRVAYSPAFLKIVLKLFKDEEAKRRRKETEAQRRGNNKKKKGNKE